MNTRTLLATLFLCSFLPGLRAQSTAPDATGTAPDSANALPVTPKQSRLTQLSQAYGLLAGQQASLTFISNKFPELAPDARQSWFAFNSSALGESGKGVEAELSRQLGEKWPELKSRLETQMQQLAESQQITKEKAATFLAEVKARGKGEMPETVRAALLSANPRYTESPGLEISEGWMQTYRTKGHPKAKGADFSISFPASWSKREGNRPNIIQFFQSAAGHGPVVCSLMVKDLPIPEGFKATPEELKSFFSPQELKTWIPAGGVFIEAQPLILEGSHAGMLVHDQTAQRMDIVLHMRATQFLILRDKSLIFIQFMASQMPGKTETLDDLQKKYLPAYRSIVNTFVNNERYK